jgi:hypothetical protein
MDKVQNKPYSSVQHTPSSESFKVYLCITVVEAIYVAVLVCAEFWLTVFLNLSFVLRDRAESNQQLAGLPKGVSFNKQQ